ncbi:hypothetical protein B0A49_10817 [Cryomyces minteri]|uniref:AB hydrolase-1 domain-containing protein n=1 Tax=Cryomyces minteri TaxID=331657 RepID=A0A4U0WK09_9PEZI|nr:hypothetical protein B0A49_10817 [Cryomyces minteri]
MSYLPGFGFTTVPTTYKYNFEALALTIGSFLAALPILLKRYSTYIFDYGAPIGLRLALENPSAVAAITSQNGNAYEEGLSSFWDPLKEHWTIGSAEQREGLSAFLTLEGTKSQYETGTRNPSTIAPESYTLDQALMDRNGNKDIQLDLLHDYRSNVPLYPSFQEYFRKSQVPLLAVWGKNDQIFAPEGRQKRLHH